MLENETIIELATRMLAKRQETGNEIESSIYGITVSTENCQNPEDIELQLLKARIEIYEKNAEEAKHNYLMAAFAEQYQKREKGSSIPILVVTPQAEVVQRKEQDKQKEASNQFYLDFQTMNDIDWNNSDEVYGWMATIADDLNNFDARLPLNKIYSEEELSALQQKYQTERLSSAQVVLNELEKHGYTGEKVEINSKDDFNRQYIANYINELKNYGMLLTEKYVDVLKEDANGIEDEVINVVYRQAQDVLENSQDKNIDRVAFDDKKMEIAEEISDVTRRREKINFILDVAKALPSLELIANATTAVQVSSDVKKEKLEAKLATITESNKKILNNGQSANATGTGDPDLAKSVQTYLSYEEDYKAKMNEIYSSIMENAKILEKKVASKFERDNRKDIEKYGNLIEQGKEQLKKTIENETQKQQTAHINNLPTYTKKKIVRPKLDESFLKNTAGQFNIAEEQRAKQIFSKINARVEEKISQEDLNEFKDAIDKLKNKNSYSIYLVPLENALNQFTQYYNQENNLVPLEKPKIDESFLRNTAGQFNIAEEQQAKRAFLKINSNSNPEISKTELDEFKEAIDRLREKNANSIYLEPLSNALQEYTDYYNSVNNKKIAELAGNALSQNMQRPKLDESFLRNTAGQFNIAEEQQAKRAFLKINSNSNPEISKTELDEFKEAIDRLREKNANSIYLEPLVKSLNQFINCYNLANGLTAPEKPKINDSFLRATAGQFNIEEERAAKQAFYKINSNSSKEISAEDLINLKQSLDNLKRANEYSVYLQPLNEALQKFANYKISYDKYLDKTGNQSVTKENNKRKYGLEFIYDNITKLENTADQLEHKTLLSNINSKIAEMLNDKVINEQDIKNIKLITENEKNLRQAKEKTINFSLDNLDKELNELVKGQASKEEVEAKLREIAKPILENLDRQIKNLESNLNNIKSSDMNQVNKIVAEYQRKAPDNIDKSGITVEAITQILNDKLQSKQKEKQDLEQKINNFVQLHEKIKNKDYPDSEKGNPKKEEPHKPHNPFKLDDEEVKGLTEPNSKLRNLANSIKEKAKKVLNWIKEHPVKAAALLATTGLVGITAVVGISSALNNAKGETNEEQTEISQEAETLATQTPIEKTVEDAMQQTVAETPVLDNSDIANQVLADEQARIASGNDAVYQDIHSAANEQNQLYAQSSDVQAIWQNTNVEAGKMYQVEADGSLSEIHGVDALVQAGNEGKTIVSTWQNEDGTLGRSVITPSEFGQSMENVEESAKTR